MITFEKDGYIFVYRVAGVAIYDKKLLVHRSIIDDFWSLPGGRCEFLEISKDALIREMKEEIGVEIKIIRPLYFVENFFNYMEKDYHELSIFYLIKFPPDSKLIFENDTFHGKEHELGFENDDFYGEELDLIFKWVDIGEIETLRLYPLFLRKSLKNIKAFPEHIINHDD
ncbi:MAG: NUDIX hydrolase [Candidatus Lokiarchaeota archaeon]|nr:NUDIX hydrolase [Candidatus Lokiarchaeota archaeon]